MNTVNLSVRVSQEDADFIAGLSVTGATTPSDKLRAIIAEARIRHVGGGSFQERLAMAEQIIAPARQRLRQMEHHHRVHSELLTAACDWVPAMMAELMTDPTRPEEQCDRQGGARAGARSGGPSGGPSGGAPGAGGSGATGGHDERAALAELERHVADRVVEMLETLLRLGVTAECRGYDPRVIASRLGPILEIARLIESARNAHQKEA